MRRTTLAVLAVALAVAVLAVPIPPLHSQSPFGGSVFKRSVGFEAACREDGGETDCSTNEPAVACIDPGGMLKFTFCDADGLVTSYEGGGSSGGGTASGDELIRSGAAYPFISYDAANAAVLIDYDEDGVADFKIDDGYLTKIAVGTNGARGVQYPQNSTALTAPTDGGTCLFGFDSDEDPNMICEGDAAERAIVAGTGAATHGVTMWADGSTITDGDAACTSIGLTCVDVRIASDGSDPGTCATTNAVVFYALCK